MDLIFLVLAFCASICLNFPYSDNLLRYHMATKSIPKVYEHSSHLYIIRNGYFTFLKFKGNFSKTNCKEFIKYVFSKSKCVSALDTSSWKHCVTSLTKGNTVDRCNLLGVFAYSSQYILQHKLWVIPHVLELVFRILAQTEVEHGHTIHRRLIHFIRKFQ
jgi:hypothetical protein